LLDQGVPFDQKKLTARSLDEVKPGGLGLHLEKVIQPKESNFADCRSPVRPDHNFRHHRTH
jgi:hypothetical protein